MTYTAAATEFDSLFADISDALATNSFLHTHVSEYDSLRSVVAQAFAESRLASLLDQR